MSADQPVAASIQSGNPINLPDLVGSISRIHHKKLKGKPMPEHIGRGNATNSSVRVHVEHVFAQQKGLLISTTGIVRAEAKIGLVNLGYNMRHLLFQERKATTA